MAKRMNRVTWGLVVGLLIMFLTGSGFALAYGC
jgi:hypothetical protein